MDKFLEYGTGHPMKIHQNNGIFPYSKICHMTSHKKHPVYWDILGILDILGSKCDQNQKCFTANVTRKKKLIFFGGGGGGSDPVWTLSMADQHI